MEISTMKRGKNGNVNNGSIRIRCNKNYKIENTNNAWFTVLVLIISCFVFGCSKETEISQPKVNEAVSDKSAVEMPRDLEANAAANSSELRHEKETNLINLKQLTFGGQNAEAYFSHDGRELIFQRTHGDYQCDAIFKMDLNGENMQLLSSGKGVTTCAFIAPDSQSIIYASTHLAGPECPPKPDYSQGYVWPLYEGYDIFKADSNGGNLRRLTSTDRYDAEAVYSPQGDRIIFTSLRSGDLELYLMDSDGNNVEQLTSEIGYDGGAFFSFDGQWIVWRASRPEGEALKDYQKLLAENLIRPGNLELFIMNLKDRKPIQLTSNGAANFGPYWHPDGKHIIFSSNMHNPRGRNFDLFLINIETSEIRQVTHYDDFDGFPMFSHDGKKLVFASNRNGKVKGETNIFLADWQMLK